MTRNKRPPFRQRLSHKTNLRNQDIDKLVESSPAAFNAFFVEEPRLIFAGGQTAIDPKAGIETFGPVGSDGQTEKNIRIGVIGTGLGIDAFQTYLEKAKQRICPGLNSRKKSYDWLCFPDFPGATETSGFRANFIIDKIRDIPIDYFNQAVSPLDVSTKLRQVVELVTKKLESIATVEPLPDVVVIVLPAIVEQHCAAVGRAFRGRKEPLSPTQKLQRYLERQKQRTGQQVLGLNFIEPESFDSTGFWNIHHALKAHAMPFGIPTQIAWESTIRGQGLTQDPASAAWNFFTALYYKSNRIPWQLEYIPENTCYVGISFYKESPRANADMQTSLAQVFSGHGEGLVLQGRKAISDKKRDGKPHLDEFGAEDLLKEALKLYENFYETKPARVVIHKTSRYWPEELKGFEKALSGVPRYDLLAIERLGNRFMRVGHESPVRGTVVTLAPGHHVVYTVGYVPALRAYPGMRVPNPIEIVEHFGHSPARLICSELLALTKINWNTCAFASSEPITLQFARTVGRIMTEIPNNGEPAKSYRRLYKFYM